MHCFKLVYGLRAFSWVGGGRGLFIGSVIVMSMEKLLLSQPSSTQVRNNCLQCFGESESCTAMLVKLFSCIMM